MAGYSLTRSPQGRQTPVVTTVSIPDSGELEGYQYEADKYGYTISKDGKQIYKNYGELVHGKTAEGVEFEFTVKRRVAEGTSPQRARQWILNLIAKQQLG